MEFYCEYQYRNRKDNTNFNQFNQNLSCYLVKIGPTVFNLSKTDFGIRCDLNDTSVPNSAKLHMCQRMCHES